MTNVYLWNSDGSFKGMASWGQTALDDLLQEATEGTIGWDKDDRNHQWHRRIMKDSGELTWECINDGQVPPHVMAQSLLMG